jgi:hypothetical protein
MKFKNISKTYAFVTLDEAKEQANISKNFLEDDALITRLLRASTLLAENYIENHIALTEYEGKQDRFIGALKEVKKGNFHSLQSITYTDRATGTETTLSAGVGYEIASNDVSFLIMLDESVDAENLIINFKCGFDAISIEAVEEIKQAVLIKFVDLYDVERSSYTTNTIKHHTTFENLLNYHKKLNFF